MRADRLLKLVLLLQTRGRMTAERLAEELEVSARTIYRDIEALSGAGFPVYAERGVGGGCRLVDGYRTTLTGLSAPEAQALAFAALPGAAAALGVGALAAAAHLKVLTAVSPDARSTLASVQERFHLDPRGWFRTTPPEHPHLPPLARAVWDGRRVRAFYARAKGRAKARVLHPLGLVLKDGIWYLVATDDDAMRTYRVSRFEQVDLLDEPVDRPPDFDLGSWWAEWADSFETNLNEYPVTVRVAPAAQQRLGELGDAVPRASKQPPPRRDRDGWERRVLMFERPDWAESILLRLGAGVEVIDPPEMRDRLEAAASELFALYHGA
jgi:predicted DNA-binding transcriptional regulator YafY